MKAQMLLAILVAGISTPMVRVPPAQPRRVGPAEIYPDPVRTPGAANLQITQRNIGDTICNRHWSTRLIRPPAGYTSRLKRKQLREYGDTIHQARAELITFSNGRRATCLPTTPGKVSLLL
jgi:hypothetical protein